MNEIPETEFTLVENKNDKRLKRNVYMRGYMSKQYHSKPEIKTAYQRTIRLRHSANPPSEEDLIKYKEWTADIINIKKTIAGIPKIFQEDIKNYLENI